MKERWQNRLFSLLVLIWGGVLLYFYVSQRIFKYLAPDFHLLVLLGALGMLVLGVFCLIGLREGEAGCCAHEHDHEHGDHGDCDHGLEAAHDHDAEECDGGHHEGHGALTAFLITLIPLGLAMAKTEDRLSQEGALKKGAYEAPSLAGQEAPLFTKETLDEVVEKTAEGDYKVSLMMAYYAAQDEQVRAIFEGLPVAVEGRLIPEKIYNDSGLRRRLYRLYISCCGADGQAVGLSLDFTELTPEPADDTWATAKGTLHYEERDGGFLPVIKVKSLEATPEPHTEFLLR